MYRRNMFVNIIINCYINLESLQYSSRQVRKATIESSNVSISHLKQLKLLHRPQAPDGHGGRVVKQGARGLMINPITQSALCSTKE